MKRDRRSCDDAERMGQRMRQQHRWAVDPDGCDIVLNEPGRQDGAR